MKTTGKEDYDFTITYQVDDGYAGGNRPQTVLVYDGDLDKDMEDRELLDLYYSMVQEDFEQRISASASNEYEFMEWAKARIVKMWEEDQ